MLLKRKRVPLNADTINKCRCMQCPVQISSTCAIGKNQKLMQENKMAPGGVPVASSSGWEGGMGAAMQMQQNPPEAMMPNKEELPGIYCSNGRASCSDISMAKNCICPTCQVYTDFKLSNASPMEHYCFNDRAE